MGTHVERVVAVRHDALARALATHTPGHAAIQMDRGLTRSRFRNGALRRSLDWVPRSRTRDYSAESPTGADDGGVGCGFHRGSGASIARNAELGKDRAP